MPFTPAGPISLAIEAARTMLADSATFRTLVGAANRAEALIHAHWRSWPEPADGAKYSATELAGYRPYGLVAPEESHASERSLVDADHGTIVILLGRADPGNDRVTDDQTWDNTVGLIRDELLALGQIGQAKGGEYLLLEEVSIEEDPFWDEADRRFGEGIEQRAVISLVY